MFKEMEKQDKEGAEFNPIYIMADSGARGSKQQIRQLAGMRGLMARPSGEIIENPITSNFREGLTVLQYFISTHGARKGLADTALKTADSGYLTRRLVDVSQDVIISEHDCTTVDGIDIRPIIESGEVIEPLRDRIVGRVSLENIKDPFGGSVIVRINEEITEETANVVQAAGIEKVRIRSVLTCESRRGVCALCYGRDLATGKLVEMGMAVGVIAAQSIGEPGTQLTMRTFHIGGTASHRTEQTTLEAKNNGAVKFHNINTVKNKKGDLVVMNRAGALVIHDQKGRERERHAVVYGATLKVKDGLDVKQGQLLVEWDPYSFTILTEEGGRPSSRTSSTARPCTSRSTRTPACRRWSSWSRRTRRSSPASRSRTTRARRSGSTCCPRAPTSWWTTAAVSPGDMLAKIPRETAKTKDITGGLPRVVELFEARRPKEPAVITEIDGVVKYGDVAKQHRKIFVTADDAEQREYQLPRGAHINVQEGERVKAGEPLMDGPIDPHDILRVRGEKELQRYLVDEIQEVYRLQGVNINDKHIEVISRQMMRWVKVEDVGDTEFLIDEVVDKFRFISENEKQTSKGKKPATGRPLLLGITKASLSTDSFISAASLPGDDPRPHRGGHQRQGRLPARPQGERHHGPPHPRRNGDGVLPPDQDPGGSHRAPGVRARGRLRARVRGGAGAHQGSRLAGPPSSTIGPAVHVTRARPSEPRRQRRGFRFSRYPAIACTSLLSI